MVERFKLLLFLALITALNVAQVRPWVRGSVRPSVRIPRPTHPYRPGTPVVVDDGDGGSVVVVSPIDHTVSPPPYPNPTNPYPQRPQPTASGAGPRGGVAGAKGHGPGLLPHLLRRDRGGRGACFIFV